MKRAGLLKQSGPFHAIERPRVGYARVSLTERPHRLPAHIFDTASAPKSSPPRCKRATSPLNSGSNPSSETIPPRHSTCTGQPGNRGALTAKPVGQFPPKTSVTAIQKCPWRTTCRTFSRQSSVRTFRMKSPPRHEPATASCRPGQAARTVGALPQTIASQDVAKASGVPS